MAAFFVRCVSFWHTSIVTAKCSCSTIKGHFPTALWGMFCVEEEELERENKNDRLRLHTLLSRFVDCSRWTWKGTCWYTRLLGNPWRRHRCCWSHTHRQFQGWRKVGSVGVSLSSSRFTNILVCCCNLIFFISYRTSLHDKTSLPAIQLYYEAVSRVCPSEKKALDGSSAFDDATDVSRAVDPKAFQDWNFAHLSFDDEPRMIWRWWIWK